MKTTLTLTAIAFASMFLAACKPDNSPEGLAARAPIEARVACMSLVRNNLRNPSSVEWVDRARWPVAQDADTGNYLVAVTYRATNGFGGVVTEKQVCVARRLSDNRMAAFSFL